MLAKVKATEDESEDGNIESLDEDIASSSAPRPNTSASGSDTSNDEFGKMS